MNKLLTLALSTSLVAGAFFLLRPAKPDGAKHLINRVWIERMPKHERDLIHSFGALDVDGQKVGAISLVSTWRVRAELFKHRLRGTDITLIFPQDKKRVRAKVKTWECEGQAPAPFELCLTIGHGDRQMKLYSMHEWVVPTDGHAPAASIPVALPAIPRDLPAVDEQSLRDYPAETLLGGDQPTLY